MKPAKRQPVALTIAGSDSGGGAGIQADLKTFASLGVHGTSAITCITAQNPKKVLVVEPSSPALVQAQLIAVFAELAPAAAKVGMLYTAENVKAVADFLKRKKVGLLVVDPVMVATSGSPLTQSPAIEALKRLLLPVAGVVTPNLSETEVLLGRKVEDAVALRAAAREFYERYGCPALVKGGHLPDLDEAVDFFYDGKTELLLKAPFVKGVSTHGTGCTYSTAIAGYYALGCNLVRAVEMAKEYISQAIAQSLCVKSHTVLNHFWR